MADIIEQITSINSALIAKYPKGNGAFQMLARLLEEAGELAEQVSIFENAGSKQIKHGQPDKAHLAQEAQDVIRCVIQVLTHYDAMDEFQISIESSYEWALGVLHGAPEGKD